MPLLQVQSRPLGCDLSQPPPPEGNLHLFSKHIRKALNKVTELLDEGVTAAAAADAFGLIAAAAAALGQPWTKDVMSQPMRMQYCSWIRTEGGREG
jgi:hypothetical protein